MKDKKNAQLIISILSVVFGIWLLFQKEENHPTSKFESGGTAIMVIDLSKKEQNPNYFYLIPGFILISIGTAYLVKLRAAHHEASLAQKLTEREVLIVSLIEQGMSNKDISNELSISLSTVKTHINNIYKKLDIRSRSDLLNHVNSNRD